MDTAEQSSPDTRRLLDVAHELYGSTLPEFTSARNHRAKELRAGGERELARAVTALHKPTVAAWAVNMMVRRMRDQVEEVLELGDRLRAAQDQLDAPRLRELNTQRRRLTAAMAREGRAVAADLGQRLSPQAVDQVGATLHAAMTDEAAAAALRTGLLVEPMSATGLAPVDLAGVLAVPEALGDRLPRKRAHTVPVRTSRTTQQRRDASAGRAGAHTGGRGRQRDERAEERARQEQRAAESARQKEQRAEERARALQEAEDAVEAAASAAAEARRRLRTVRESRERLQARSLQLRAELDELRRQVDEREFALDRVEEDLDQAGRECDSAGAAEAAAERALEQAHAQVDLLRQQPGKGQHRR